MRPENSAIKLVGLDHERLERLGENCADPCTAATIVVVQQDNHISIQSGDLAQLTSPIPLSNPTHVERTVAHIKSIVHWRSLRDLRNPDPRLSIAFEYRKKEAPSAVPNPQTVTPGTHLIYKVRNLEQDTPLYIYVLDVSTDGSVALLHPPLGRQEQLAPKAVLEREISMFLPQGMNVVKDVLKVIATTERIDPSIFPQGTLRNAPPPRNARSVDNPLANFLAQATRGTRGAVPVSTGSWITAQQTVTIRPPEARFSGFSIHFDTRQEALNLPNQVGDSRSVCSENVSEACLNLESVDPSGTEFELTTSSATRGNDDVRSVGELFDEAYSIQDQTGASRVEPLLEVQTPGVVDDQGIDKREILSDREHDTAAASDDQWNLKQIRAFDAWKKIRETHGVAEGREGRGILVAHTDTGYLEHPENWVEIDGKRPIDPAKGYDYFDNDHDPTDPLLDSRKLDNPAHGTASGSVIVSPPRMSA